MTTAIKRTAFGLMLFALAGCATAPKPLTNEEIMNGALVFFYLDASEMGGHLDWATLKQVQSGKAPSYWRLPIVDEKVVFHQGLEAGSYQMYAYGGSDGLDVGCLRLCSNTNYTYNFPAQGGGFKVKKKGIYFLGSFKHKKVGGFFSNKFDLERLKSPSEKEVLKTVIETLEKYNSPKVPTLKRYYAKLK